MCRTNMAGMGNQPVMRGRTGWIVPDLSETAGAGGRDAVAGLKVLAACRDGDETEVRMRSIEHSEEGLDPGPWTGRPAGRKRGLRGSAGR